MKTGLLPAVSIPPMEVIFPCKEYMYTSEQFLYSGSLPVLKVMSSIRDV